MDNKFQTIPQEVSPFVEALQSVLQAEDKSFSSFLAIYGDKWVGEGAQSPGEQMYYKSPLPSLFEEVKESLRSLIGMGIEMGLSNLLETPKKEEESVC